MGVMFWHTCGDFKIVRNKVSNSKIGILDTPMSYHFVVSIIIYNFMPMKI
jgi:hypothetical protein